MTDDIMRQGRKKPPFPVVFGRPPKYNKKVLSQVDKYLAKCKDEELKLVKQSNSEKGYEMYENKLRVNLPTLKGFAKFIDVDETTMHIWRTRRPEFKIKSNKILAEQYERLINMGLSNEYNPVITKLMLMNNHGMSDNKKVKHSGGISLAGIVNGEEEDQNYEEEDDTEE